jgi:hypothetical protein
LEQASTAAPLRAHLPIILGTAVLQGWALYGLHRAITEQMWPATDHGWLFALYAVAVLIPVTIEILSDHIRDRATWIIIAVMAGALWYFGWHHGRSVADLRAGSIEQPADVFPLALVLAILWLHTMPFLQARLAAGRWTADYQYLFAHAWRNSVALAEALVFTGLFWLLLFLWQSLFHMLGMDFFRELFDKPIFVYPVTSIVFGSALYLIGSIDRFVTAVLEQILNLFKWLGTVTGALLALFTLALLIKLPGLLFTGNKAIGSSWLLWLVAVVVLFLNAAYRDGTAAKPYPRWIAASLRFVVPLTVIIASTAAYALYVRTQHYGFTVDRVWAFIVTGAAVIYAVGYTIAAFNSTTWFGGVARVNVFAALSVIGVLGLALTPVLSPYRLAANSQYQLVLAGRYGSDAAGFRNASPFQYLRFDAGAYGRGRLVQLTQLQNHADAARIQELANAALRASGVWETVATRTDDELISHLRVFPAGRTMDPELIKALRADLHGPSTTAGCLPGQGQELVGLFVDLKGDGDTEFVLWNMCRGILYQRNDRTWQMSGTLVAANTFARGADLVPELSMGQVTTAKRPWQDLVVGKHRFQVLPNQEAPAGIPIWTP